MRAKPLGLIRNVGYVKLRKITELLASTLTTCRPYKVVCRVYVTNGPSICTILYVGVLGCNGGLVLTTDYVGQCVCCGSYLTKSKNGVVRNQSERRKGVIPNQFDS